MLDKWYRPSLLSLYLIFFDSLTIWNSIKQSGNLSQLNSLFLEIFSATFSGRFELLNEILNASKEPEWIEHVQEQIIDIIWLLGNQI
jgi:hypothetical protein